MLCADLIDVHWKDKGGRLRRTVANLEDISLSGACLQTEQALPLDTRIKMTYANGELRGRVCYCIYREIGYFLGIEFDAGMKWSIRQFRPQHLLDPRRLAARAASRAARKNTTTDLLH